MGKGRALALVALFAAGLSSPARAHDLWLEHDAGAWVLLRGHRHSAHTGEEILAYDAANLVAFGCTNEAGASIAAVADSSYPLRLKGGCAAAWAVISTGYWTKTPEETNNRAPAPGDRVVKSWLSFECAKGIGRWGPGLARPLSRHLELTPVEDPLVRKPGDTLMLLVTLNGEPLPDAIVSYAGKRRGRTDGKGHINIRLREPGFQLIQASIARPDPLGKVIEIVHEAALSFVLEDRS